MRAGPFPIHDSHGREVDLEELVARLKQDQRRVLADDEIGLVLYVGDLDLYRLGKERDGRPYGQLITQISLPRLPVRLVRRQIGHTVFSMTPDTIFLIRDGEVVRKVRAENLKVGMITFDGKKVLQ